jgi:hypothetical protein
MTIIFGAQGVSPTFRGQPGNTIKLQGGQTYLVPPGTWDAQLGPYSCAQQYDPLTTIWRSIGGESSMFRYINSDGNNYRIANLTGCVVGAQVTNKGSGYLAPPTVTDNGGGGVTYLAILGPVVSTITVLNGGTGYVYPPIVQISAPPSPGIQATAYATLSAGVVSTITITDEGGNYVTPATVTITNDPRDTVGSGAVAAANLSGAATIAGIVVTNPGSPITSTSAVPTITITAVNGGTSGAATPLMCSTITGYTVTSAGSGYSGTVEISALGTGYGGSAAAYTNPKIQDGGLVRTRAATIIAATSAGTIVTSGATYLDGGIYDGFSPTQIIYGFASGTAAAVGNVAFVWGSATDTIQLYAV